MRRGMVKNRGSIAVGAEGGANVVKGYQRRVVVVKGMEGGAFEQAFFVLRREEEPVTRSSEELLAQAELLIARNSLREPFGRSARGQAPDCGGRGRGRRWLGWLLAFLAGAFVGVGVCLLIFLT